MEFVREWAATGMSVIALGTAVWGILQGPARKNEQALESFKSAMAADLKEFKGAMTGALDDFRRATTGQIKALDDRIDAAEAKLGQIDTVIENLPDKDAFHQLDKGLTEVRGKIDTISVVVDSAGQSLTRIEGFLINAASAAQNNRGH